MESMAEKYAEKANDDGYITGVYDVDDAWWWESKKEVDDPSTENYIREYEVIEDVEALREP